jgi:hypothetical protein
MSHDPAMTRAVASIAVATGIAGACLASPAGAVAPRWSAPRCQLQQAQFNVRHPHPTGIQLAGGNRTLKRHGCTQRVPGPKRWPEGQCLVYQAVFVKLNAFPTAKQVAAADDALKSHGCRQRV